LYQILSPENHSAVDGHDIDAAIGGLLADETFKAEFRE
jgi:hypothetical protein